MVNKIVFLLANIGFLISAYLLWTYISNAPIACGFSGCDVVRSSPYSYLLGLPLPAYGLAFYGVLTILSLANRRPRKILGIEALKIMFIVAAIGFAFSAYLTYLEAFVIKAFCVWCVASAVVATIIFGILVKESIYGKIFKLR